MLKWVVGGGDAGGGLMWPCQPKLSLIHEKSVTLIPRLRAWLIPYLSGQVGEGLFASLASNSFRFLC